MIAQLFLSKLSTDKINKVIEVSNRLKINPNWLLGVMYFESSRTFSPSVTNSIGSVGLIQFTKDAFGLNYKTINGKRYLLSDLAKMSFIQQMDIVELYYKTMLKSLKITTLNSFLDVYLITFFPIAVNKSLDYAFKTNTLSSSKIASQNPIFDRNKDLQITKNEVLEHFKNYYKENFNFINIDVLQNQISTKSILKTIENNAPIILTIFIFFYTVGIALI